MKAVKIMGEIFMAMDAGMKGPRVVAAMTDPIILAESSTANKAAAAAPFGAKSIVDAMELKGVDFANLGKDTPQHGIPTTREEFDKAYANTASLTDRDMLRSFVAAASKFASNEALQDQTVDLSVATVKKVIPDVISELKGRGTAPSGFIKEFSKMILGPADIDLSTLDERLTPAEREWVVASKAISTKLTDGRLQSKPEDAPTTEWANRIRAQQAAAQGKANGVA